MDHKKLNQLFNQLVIPNIPEERIIHLLKEIKTNLHKLSEYKGNNTFDNISLNQGVAVNCKLASDCFDDYLRTYSFMLATLHCIRNKTKNRTKKIKILYAGTEPFSTIKFSGFFVFKFGC